MLGSLTLLVWTKERVGAFRPCSRTSVPNAVGITKKFMFFSIPALLSVFSTLYAPTLSGSGIFPYQSQDYPLRILSSKDSITGIVVVGELLPLEGGAADPTVLESVRYLRVSHSLLGGVWIGSNVASLDGSFRTDQAGTPLGDSIYGAFVLQEAVRLASNNPRGDSGKPESALVM